MYKYKYSDEILKKNFYTRVENKISAYFQSIICVADSRVTRIFHPEEYFNFAFCFCEINLFYVRRILCTKRSFVHIFYYRFFSSK